MYRHLEEVENTKTKQNYIKMHDWKKKKKLHGQEDTR